MQNVVVNKLVAFIRKYKILHILFWTWSFIDLLHLQQQYAPKNDHTLITNVAIIKFGEICCVYFVIYFLMPRYLQKGKYIQFGFCLLLSIVGADILTLALQDLETLNRLNRHMRFITMKILFVSHWVDTITGVGLFFAIYTVQDRYSTEMRNKLLEKERLETELNFLKAQINPHFLFNAINSIYVLIEEDKRLASQTLLKFSGLLRYQLYDCSNDHMPLARELEFLNDYIELERLRNGDNLKITFRNDTEPGNREIAPFVLIPFVENAFKHRSHNEANNFVSIKAEVLNDTLHFTVTNTYDEGLIIDSGKNEGGIGLQNAHRRLELLYKDNHELTAIKADGVYSVNLQLKLNENAMYIG